MRGNTKILIPKDPQALGVLREYKRSKQEKNWPKCIRIRDANPDIDFAIIDELGLEDVL